MPRKKKTAKNKCKYANGIKAIKTIFFQNPLTIEYSTVMSFAEKRIMNFICRSSNGELIQIPNKLIAHFSYCSDMTVSTSISHLVKLGYLTRTISSGVRLLAITKEDLGYIWECERSSIIKWFNEYVIPYPKVYEAFVAQSTAHNQNRKKDPDDLWSIIREINKNGGNNDNDEEEIEAETANDDSGIELFSHEEVVPQQKSDTENISKNTQSTQYVDHNSFLLGGNPLVLDKGPLVLQNYPFVPEKSREPAPIAESRDFSKSRSLYKYRELYREENIEEETSLSKERLCVSSFSKEKKESASEPSVRRPPVELKKNPGEKNKTSSERIMPIDDDPPESEDFLREQYADYLNQILLKEIEDSLVEDKDFLEAEYSTFCQQTFLKAEANKDPVPDDDDSPYYNQNRPAPPPPRKLSKEEEWAKWHLTAEDKAYIEKRRLERLAEEAEAKAKLDEEKKKYDEEEARLAKMTPEEQWEEIYGKREGEYKNAVVSAYAHDLPEWIEKTSRMYRHLFKKDYVPTQEEIDLFRAKLKANQMNENNGNGKRSPKKNIPKIGLIDPNYVEIDEDCREIIDYWEKMGFPKVKEKEMKKTVENILMFLNGTMKKCLPESMFEGGYHSFSKEQMIQAINNRHIKAFNDEYMPTEEFKKKMRRTTLQSWFYIPGNVPIPSPFVYDLANKPWKNKNAGKEQIKDVNPAFTNLIKKQYVEKVIGIEPKKWSFEDEKRFRMATKRFEDFRRENAKRLDPLILNPPTVDSIASLFFRSVGHAVDFNWGNINIGWLCSDKQFDERLPYYLQQQGFMRN